MTILLPTDSESGSSLHGQTYIIIHGTKGSPSINWFPWLATQLRKRGARVLIPQMPTPTGQTLENWFGSFQVRSGRIDQQTCIIGHSLGATFLLRYLERCKAPVCCSIFVAGLIGPIGIPEYDELNRTFVNAPYDWGTIRRNAGQVMCFAGDKDPYVPLHQPREIAEKLGAALQIIPGGGHLNSETGYESFDELLHALVGV